jgi:hypothetical protein
MKNIACAHAGTGAGGGLGGEVYIFIYLNHPKLRYITDGTNQTKYSKKLLSYIL